MQIIQLTSSLYWKKKIRDRGMKMNNPMSQWCCFSKCKCPHVFGTSAFYKQVTETEIYYDALIQLISILLCLQNCSGFFFFCRRQLETKIKSLGEKHYLLAAIKMDCKTVRNGGLLSIENRGGLVPW